MRASRIRLVLEELESRDLLSASVLPVEPLFAPPTHNVPPQAANEIPSVSPLGQAMPDIVLQPANTRNASSPKGGPPAGQQGHGPTFNNLNPAWFTPDQIRQAYGFNQVPSLMSPTPATVSNTAYYNSTAGKGETIAIVDGGDDPNILNDVNVFSGTQQIGLPQFTTTAKPVAGEPTFTKLNEYGQDITSSTSNAPRPQTNAAWASEISLDVEWAHAIAPQANIVLVEANADSTGNVPTSDMFNAINTASTYPGGVATVSMSWGYWEGDNSPPNYVMQKNMTTDDAKYFPPTTPITFVAATLDNGSSAYEHDVYWPAISPNVLAVGGTTLSLNASGNYLSESGWKYSTGGLSKYGEAEPSYQKGVVPSSMDPTGARANPDVAYAASGFAIYDTVPYDNQIGWFDASGTSAGTPQWAALVTLADQERAANSLAPLSSTQTLDALYSFAAKDPSYFHDITSGSNGAYNAVKGYDLVTGIGTPVANQLIPALANSTAS